MFCMRLKAINEHVIVKHMEFYELSPLFMTEYNGIIWFVITSNINVNEDIDGIMF